MTATDLLDNIYWHTLTGLHAKYAAGANGARRYARGFSPIVGFANVENPDFDALIPFFESGEQFYCGGWTGHMPQRWRIESESTMCCMMWRGEMLMQRAAREPGENPEMVRLGPQHALQALELATLTNPGPFGPRTIELGEYFGCFEGSRLVAMAGERMHADPLHEISGVCTHPDFQGRGLARRLIGQLIVRQLERHETPFLHVMSANTAARQLYASMGFQDYRETAVRIVSLR